MAKQLQDKVALVTGGAAGIGRAAAMQFAKAGAKVAISDLKEEQGKELAQAIEKEGGEAIFLTTDVSDAGQVQKMVADTVKRFGKLDCAFNNAGIEGQMAPTADCSTENFDRTIAINLRGVWLCMQHEIKEMLKHKSGTIVNMSSVAGLVGFPNLPAYVASKHGVVGLTKSAALEYAQSGIRVNAVCPGVIHTEMIDRITHKDSEIEKQFIGLEPIGRMGTPEEVGALAVWLCSPESSFMTGTAVPVDGGFVAH